ncbi:FxsB family cyclophane-forming radical SAM/SPASM peptide maturase [Streptomyces adonidis]|uniref:FxsB family cyclophane-forming radical SAM/SPASM peptide maturase n=1 Tax=Streptomyces adonidis TaxID=3231367 RepID=UPI0034DB041A
MVPFRQFLLKIHSRCNLACDYCYMYESADQSWHDRPKIMELETVHRTAALIAEHARDHALAEVHVILHGGEPLLVGEERLEALLGVFVDALDGVAELKLTLQTNGLRLVEDPALFPLLARYGVRIGVSLDGTPANNDKHRRRPDGSGSHATVAGALRLLADGQYRPLYAGVLCVIDLTADPVETYEALLEFAPPRLDLLLPHATWHTPPPRLSGRTTPPLAPPGADLEEPVPYARWLCEVFDHWYGAPSRRTGIRLFEEISVLLLGGTGRSESVGLAPVDLVVVETDGTIEQADSLKVTYPGAPATGLDVFGHTFADAARHEAFRARQRGRAGLAPVCAACPRAAICGGGLYAHRYHPGAVPTPFAAPSVYCADLAVLIDHIADRLSRDVPLLVGSARSARG